MSLCEGEAGDQEISIKDELHGTETVERTINELGDEGADTDGEEPRPRDISDKNIDSLLEELDTASPLVKEYLKIARNCEFASDLRFNLGYNHTGVFLSVSNVHPDLYLLYRNNISLVVRGIGSDLFCTLYNYKHQIFKGMVIKDFANYLKDESTHLGIAMFLKELDRDRYRVCSGAFTEGELIVDLNKENIKSLLIEKFEGSIVYRSRECFTLVPGSSEESGGCGTSSCECCLKLKMDLALSLREKGFQGYPDPPDDMDLSSDNPLSSFVEVCMDSDNEDSNPADTEKGLDDKENQMGGEGEGGSFPTSFSEFSRNLRLTQQRKVKSTKISYKKLIISALISSPNNRLKLTEIYDWILDRYPLFNENKQAFQNSIRHNLSLNRIFVKVSSETGSGYSPAGAKGGYWTIEPSELRLQKRLDINQPDSVRHKAMDVDGFKIKLPRLPPKYFPPEKKDLNISSRFVAIAPKPSLEQNDKGSANQNDEEGELGSLVIDEKSDPIRALPANIKEQLKTGVPIILRPLDNPTSSSIIIAPTSAVNLSPVVSGANGKSKLGISLAPRPSATLSVIPSPAVTSTPSSGQSGSPPALVVNPVNPTPKAVKQVASVNSNEFPKPPFSYKELCMISIFYAAEKELTLSSIYDHIKLWFPYYRQTSIGATWQNSIRHSLSLNSAFTRVGESPEKGGKWTFDLDDSTWNKLLTSNKWFETPLDADLFNYMASNVPAFQQKVYSKRNLFKSVPITVKADAKLAALAAEAGSPSKRIKLEQQEEDDDEDEDDEEKVGEHDTIDVKEEMLDDQSSEEVEEDLEDEEDPLA